MTSKIVFSMYDVWKELQKTHHVGLFCRSSWDFITWLLILRSPKPLSVTIQAGLYPSAYTRAVIHAPATPQAAAERYTWGSTQWDFSPATPLDSTFLEPFVPRRERFALSLPPIMPPRMFIAQKIISLVISAPLWAAINFSSLHDGPACGHGSLTFSKRSINLSVHPATYPLMFSSSPVVFFFFLPPPLLHWLLAVGW